MIKVLFHVLGQNRHIPRFGMNQYRLGKEKSKKQIKPMARAAIDLLLLYVALPMPFALAFVSS